MGEEAYIGEIMLFAGRTIPRNWARCDGRALDVRQYQALYSVIGNTYGGDQKQFNLPDLRGCVPVGTGKPAAYPEYVLGTRGGVERNIIKQPIPLPAHTHTARFEKGEISNGQLTQGTIINGTLVDGKVTDAEATKIAVNSANTTFTAGIPSPADNVLAVGLTSSAQTRNYNASSTPGKFLGGVTGGDGSKVSGVVKGDVSGSVTGNVKGTVILDQTGVSNSQLSLDIDVRQPYVGLSFLICLQGIYPQGDDF